MIIERNQCVICDSEIVLKKTINNIPIHMNVKADSADDITLDQNWGECINCGCVQLMNLVSPDVLYSVNHNPGSQGNLWKEHHQAFAEFILNNKPEAIFEIGGSNGNLASIIVSHVDNINYSIVDPTASASDNRIKVYNMLFEDYQDKITGSVVHSHTIEHVLNPREFLYKIFNLMPDNGEMYMSFPNMKQGLISNGASTLCFEHTYYIDLQQFKYLLEEVGFEIKDQIDFKLHSHFLQVMKNKNRQRQYQELKKDFNQISAFGAMWKSNQEFVDNVLLNLDSTPTYIFGAHIFSQSLIALGLRHQSIKGIIDDDPSKIGGTLYGSDLVVYSCSHLANDQAVNVVLRAGPYQDEMRSRFLNLNSKVRVFE
jgi:hypothetical protein